MASRCFSSSKIYVFFFLVWQSCLVVRGDIIVSPRDTETSIGEITELNCASTVGAIEWHHLRPGSDFPEIVYKNGYVYNGYKERFYARNCNDAAGECNLVIHNVSLKDSGTYTCMEKSEEAAQKAAQLIVFELYPSSHSCVTRITCSPDCDALELSCKAKYSANIDALMEWRDSARKLVPSAVITINATATSTVGLHLDKALSKSPSYTCQVIYPTISLVSRYNWTPRPQDLLESNAAQEASNQTVVALTVSLVATMMLVVGLLGILGLLLWTHKRKVKKCYTPEQIEENADAVHPLIEQQTPLVTEEPEIDESWTDGEIAPRTKANKNKAICGLSVMDNELFFITKDGCIVEVFDLNTFAFLRAWSVDGLVNPNDMVSCQRTKRLYICDWKKSAEDNEIFCVDKDGTIDTKWISESQMGRLSITEEFHVIVAEGWYNMIKEFSPNGQLIKRFQTDRNKLHLWHAIKLGNGYFVASFGDSHDDFQEVCIIDDQGKTINSFSSNSDMPTSQSMAVPRTLAVDDDGTIYVSDLYNGRIIMLTFQLQWKGELDVTSQLQWKEDPEDTKTNEKLRGPLRIYLHESRSKRQLLVADNKKENKKWTDGKILIFDLNKVERRQVTALAAEDGAASNESQPGKDDIQCPANFLRRQVYRE